MIRTFKLRIGSIVICRKCEKARYFGYGPCSSCGDVVPRNKVAKAIGTVIVAKVESEPKPEPDGINDD